MERTITIVKIKKKRGGNSTHLSAKHLQVEMNCSLAAPLGAYWGGNLGNKLMLNT